MEGGDKQRLEYKISQPHIGNEHVDGVPVHCIRKLNQTWSCLVTDLVRKSDEQTQHNNDSVI